jgi:hypothetical protein
MGDEALNALVDCGLRERFPEECKQWIQRKDEAHRVYKADISTEATQIENKLQRGSPQLERVLQEAIVDAIIETFPYVVLSLPPAVVEFLSQKHP